MDTPTTITEKRTHLFEMSQAVKKYVEAGDFANINEAVILMVYTKDGHNTFKTYEQWKKEGFQVQKGQKAFYVWGKPLSKQQEEKAQEAIEAGPKFFPLCFLFSNLQVDKIG